MPWKVAFFTFKIIIIIIIYYDGLHEVAFMTKSQYNRYNADHTTQGKSNKKILK